MAKTYRNSCSIACTDIWPAVKATLADQEHYARVIVNDEKMKGDYQPKHTVHVEAKTAPVPSTTVPAPQPAEPAASDAQEPQERAGV